eukprot:TRINITY_DN4012_c0_g2_i1.p1 TRINITY_DN4012_c0_g2~~TRINITY_DN4012_c0_g2_i1.p1  ORF type:complete len:136 (+),score=9.81 TRINITY_DN4012_c0_g2_i1:325-732(+)
MPAPSTKSPSLPAESPPPSPKAEDQSPSLPTNSRRSMLGMVNTWLSDAGYNAFKVDKYLVDVDYEDMTLNEAINHACRAQATVLRRTWNGQGYVRQSARQSFCAEVNLQTSHAGCPSARSTIRGVSHYAPSEVPC